MQNSASSIQHHSPSISLSSGDDRLAKESDVTVGGDAVPPSTEYFGFALYVGSLFTLLIYILWAFLPRSILYSTFHIYYIPSKWWALAIPCYLFVLILYIYVALACFNTEILTKKATDLCTVTDKHARIVKCSQETTNGGKRTQESINYSTYQQKYLFNPSDGVWDLPLSEVNKLLYYSSTDDQENESNLVEIY